MAGIDLMLGQWVNLAFSDAMVLVYVKYSILLQSTLELSHKMNLVFSIV